VWLVRVEVALTAEDVTSTRLVYFLTNSKLNLLSTSTWKRSERSVMWCACANTVGFETATSTKIFIIRVKIWKRVHFKQWKLMKNCDANLRVILHARSKDRPICRCRARVNCALSISENHIGAYCCNNFTPQRESVTGITGQVRQWQMTFGWWGVLDESRHPPWEGEVLRFWCAFVSIGFAFASPAEKHVRFVWEI